MDIIRKLVKKQNDWHGERPVTIAFLGDSVTNGCFELFERNDGVLDTVYDKKSVYHERVREILEMLFPEMPVVIINAGINGDNAPGGLKRLERDVLSYKPDMLVVCYGLNDVSKGAEAVAEYTDALAEIFKKTSASGSEIIFMTPNMRNVSVNNNIECGQVRSIAEAIVKADTELGHMDLYIDAAKQLCREMNVKVCDCYGIWKQMDSCGINVSKLLSNHVNHPTREMHYMFAYELIKTMLSD